MRSSKKRCRRTKFFYAEYSADQFTFYDDAFTLDLTEPRIYAKKFYVENCKYHGDYETRVDIVSKPLIKKESGLHSHLVRSGIWFPVDQMHKKFKE